MEGRRHPRYGLETEICIYPRNLPVVRRHTVDISESGISAMLRIEVPLGEVVRLEFILPPGAVRSTCAGAPAKRLHGFQFVESSTAQHRK